MIEAHAKGELKEMFGSGTAAVVSHVQDVTYQDVTYDMPAVEDRKIGPMIKDILTSIKEHKVDESFGWVTAAKSSILETSK